MASKATAGVVPLIVLAVAVWFNLYGLTVWPFSYLKNDLKEKSFMPFIEPPKYYNLTEDVLKHLNLLDKSNLSFGLVPRDAANAVQRASGNCKAELLRIARLAVDEELHPVWLPSFCPSPGRESRRFLGCFQDGRTRFLNDTHVVLKTENSPESCVDYCRLGGFSFAGVQYGKECWCGKHFPANPVPLPLEKCDMACTGDPSKTCGGFYTVAVYDTGTNGVPFGVENIPGENEIEEYVEKNGSVRVAFMLVLNGRNYRQVARLLRNIYSAEHFYYVHVDLRAEFLYGKLLPLNKTQNIYVVPTSDRRSSIWGGASLLTVILDGFSVIRRVFPEADFVLNLSESDFPLRNISDFLTHLSSNRGKNFLRSHGSQPHDFFTKQGLTYVFVECDRRMWNVGKERIPAGISFDGGSDWFILSSDFVDYVVSEGRKLGEERLFSGLKQFYSYKLLPVEMFFHTLLANSAQCATRVNAHLRGINWQRKKSCGCRSKRVVDWCGCSPSIFRAKDIERLKAFGSRKVFFGRKFDSTVDLNNLNALETEVLGNRPAESEGEGFEDLVYGSQWLNVFHAEFDEFKASLLQDAFAGMITDGNLGGIGWNGQLLSVFKYYSQDEWLGYLIHMKPAENQHNHVQIEALFTLKNGHDNSVHLNATSPQVAERFLEKNPHCESSKLLKDAFITTEVEQKDGIWRNQARDITTNDDLWVVSQWDPAIMEALHPSSDPQDAVEKDHITVLLVDLEGTPYYEINITLKADNRKNEDLFTFTEFSEDIKLEPGVWSMALIYPHGRCVVHAGEFVILPDGGEASKVVKKEKSKIEPKSWLDFGSLAASASVKDNIDQLLSSPQEFVRAFAESKYQLQDWCLVRCETCSNEQLQTTAPACEDVPWSSMAPDAKSDLSSILHLET